MNQVDVRNLVLGKRAIGCCRRVLPLTVLIAALPLIAGIADEPGAGPGAPPGQARILSASGVARFPFDIYRGDIRFQGTINGRDAHLLLDDGFMWDPILFWGGPLVDSLGLVYDGETSIGDEDDTTLQSLTASDIAVCFPGVAFTGQTAIITPYSSGTSSMWSGSVGQVSATFFKHFVVDINFDEMMITLIDPREFEPKGRGTEIPWKPMGFGPWAIPGRLTLADGRNISLDLMMDLGYNDQLEIATAGEHTITAPDRALPQSLGFNIQREETRGSIGRVPCVTIGGYEVKDVLAGFVSEEDNDHTLHEVMIGLGLLSRFNLVFDHAQQRMFIEPNHTFADPFEHDMSGLTLRQNRDGDFEVVHIHPASPAETAGLHVGDTITQINGSPASEFDRWNLRPLLIKEGETIDLVVSRVGKKRTASLTLKRLI
jgi:hypothetical protein